MHLYEPTAITSARLTPRPAAVGSAIGSATAAAPTPYYQDEAVTLYCGDSDGTRGDVPLLGQPTERFDAIVTDPPYNASVKRASTDRTGRLRRRDGTAVKIWRDFGDWDHDWPPGPFLAYGVTLLRHNGSLIAFTTEHLLGDYMLSGLIIGAWGTGASPTPPRPSASSTCGRSSSSCGR